MRHACANIFCTGANGKPALIPLAKLACPSCWGALNTPLQQRISTAWALKNRRDHSEAVREARMIWRVRHDVESQRTQGDAR